MTRAANGGDGAFANVWWGDGRCGRHEAKLRRASRRSSRNRISTDYETAANDLVRLVLALVERCGESSSARRFAGRERPPVGR